MTSEQERKNKRIGWIVSSGFHLALLLLFIFLIAWREPNPPLPEYGIEINFGTSEVGSGDIQPEDVSNQIENQENSQQDDLQSEEDESEVEETVPDQPEQEPITEETVEIPEITEDIESPDLIEEKSEPNTIKEEQKEETQNAKGEITEQPVEDGKEDTEGNQNEEAKEEEASTSHGDNIDKEGDKGDEEGTLDARALYGNKGGGGGVSYQLAGWIIDFEPKVDDTISERGGKIVFEITIDDQGEIISVKTIERSVSPSVEKLYKDEVQRLTFSKTAENTRPAPVSKGKITFIIKAR